MGGGEDGGTEVREGRFEVKRERYISNESREEGGEGRGAKTDEEGELVWNISLHHRCVNGHHCIT